MAYCHRQCLPLNLGLILCQILFWSEDLMIQDFSPSIGLVFKNFLINCLLGIYLQTYIDTMLSQPYLIPTPEKLPIMFFTKKKEEKKITTKIGSTLNRIQLFLYNFGGAIYFVSQCIIIYNSLIFSIFFFFFHQ